MKPSDTVPLARTGDLCLIAQPSQSTTPAALQFQKDLQTRFGGEPTRVLHLTIQRFTPTDEKALDAIWDRLSEAVVPYLPIRVYGESLQTMFSDFRGCSILKARVTADGDLESLTNDVDEVIRAFGMVPHYNFFSLLVTMLEAIDVDHPVVATASEDWPSPLVTIDTLFLCRLVAPGGGVGLREVTVSRQPD